LATSGSVNFNLNRNEIVTEALELAGVADVTDSPSSDIITSSARTLNIMIKGWQTAGIYLWKQKDFYVFVNKNTNYYDLGPSGDHATLSYVKTEVATAQTSGNNTIVVDSDTGISDGDYIGIELSGGSLQWTTINGAPSSDTITLTDNLTGDVSVDANVYTYTTKINRPLWINEKGQVSIDGGNENPIRIVARNDYKDISIKTSDGVPNMAWYDPQTTNGRLYIWPEPSSVKDFLKLNGRFPVEDFDASTDDADFPQEWYLALTWQLACLLAPKFLKRTMDPQFIAMANGFLDMAASFDKDWGSFQIEVDIS